MSENEKFFNMEKLTDKEKSTLFVEELKIVQNIINRMAQNSFLIKGWTVALVAGVFLLKIDNPDYIIGSIFPIIGFWWLDAFFLKQERLFRKLYNNRISNTKHLFGDMNTTNFKKEVNCLLRIMFSQTLILFYGVTITLVIISYYLRF